MTAPTKTEYTFLAGTFLGNAGITKGTALDVRTVHTIGIYGFIGRLNGTAHATPWARLILMGNPSYTNEQSWEQIDSLVMPAGASIANTTLNGAVSANASTFAVASATNIAAGDRLFLSHGSDATKYEVIPVLSISGTTITPCWPVVNAHDSGAAVTDQAETMIGNYDVSGYSRVRVDIVNNSGQSVTAACFGCYTVF